MTWSEIRVSSECREGFYDSSIGGPNDSVEIDSRQDEAGTLMGSGILGGDRITAINGRPIRNLGFEQWRSEWQAGQVRLTIMRSGVEVILPVQQSYRASIESSMPEMHSYQCESPNGGISRALFYRNGENAGYFQVDSGEWNRLTKSEGQRFNLGLFNGRARLQSDTPPTPQRTEHENVVGTHTDNEPRWTGQAQGFRGFELTLPVVVRHDLSPLTLLGITPQLELGGVFPIGDRGNTRLTISGLIGTPGLLIIGYLFGVFTAVPSVRTALDIPVSDSISLGPYVQYSVFAGASPWLGGIAAAFHGVGGGLEIITSRDRSVIFRFGYHYILGSFGRSLPNSTSIFDRSFFTFSIGSQYPL